MVFYKIIDNSTNSILKVAQQKDLIYVRNNNGSLVAFKDSTKFSPCGFLVDSKLYLLEDLSSQIPNLNSPIVTMRKIGLKEYNYLKDILIDDVRVSEGLNNIQEDVPLDNSTLKASKNFKILKIKNECNSTIEKGIELSLGDGSSYTFELTIEDQLNLQNIKYLISQGETQFAYHSKGEPFRYYSKEEMQLIIDVANKHILYHNSYFNSLRDYINSLEKVEEVDSIYYGQDFPNKYKSEVLLSFMQKIN